MKYYARNYGGKYSHGSYTVCSANGFVCVQASRQVALAKLAELGIDPAILDTTVEPHIWRSAFISATSAVAVASAAAVEQAASESDLQAVRERQTQLDSVLNEVVNDVATLERELTERDEAAAYAAEFTRLQSVLSTQGYAGPDIDLRIKQHLEASRASRV